MKNYEVFRNAPITEAVLEIIVKLREEVTLENLKQIHDRINERFPEVGERREFKGGFTMGGQVHGVQTEEKVIGLIFHSSQEKKVLQARLNGFAFSKLKPYETWVQFRDEARELWYVYSEIAKPERITRISLRYINRIQAPPNFKDFGEYILTNPQIAPKLPQGVSHFFMRLVIPYVELSARAVIVFTMEESTKSGELPLIFDIDVLKDTDYTEDTDQIWSDFEMLRELKNDIFFNSITEKAKELFR